MEISFALVFFAVIAIFVISAIKIVPQQTAFVVESLGKFSKTLDAGPHFIFPIINQVRYKHSLKEFVLDIPEQVCITRDNVSVTVDGVIFFRVVDPYKASYGINNYTQGIIQLAQTTLRSEIGKLDLDKSFEERETVNAAVVMAIDYIAITAQGTPQADNTYKLRMPEEHVQRAIDMARKVDGIAILEMQIGYSTLERELPLLEKFLMEPDVHLALDPEFSMKPGALPPGDEIGTFSSADINYAINYLSEIVKTNDLPPKILVVHRFTHNMVTGYQNIQPTPEVQVVMVMDGWGFGAKKINTYNQVIYPEPVQFTGFKIFYKNDLKPPSTRLLTPAEVLELTPSPSFIQYQ